MSGKIKAVLALGAMLALGFCAGTCWQATRSGERHDSWWRHQIREHRLTKLKKDLDLTPAQDTAVREIFQRGHDRMRHAREVMDGQMAIIHRDSMDSIRKTLSPEQTRRFDQFHLRMHEKRHTPVEQPLAGPPLPDDTHPAPGTAR